MKKQFFILLFLAIAIYGQEKVAIINTVDDGKPPIGYLELSHLTKKLRGIASNVLPKKNYTIMTEDYIIDISGSQEEAEKKCEEAGGCLAKFGREIKVHYIAQARIGRFAEDLTIAVELYDTRSSELLGSLEGEAKDVYGLISVLEEKAPYMFRKMPGVSGGSKISPLILEGYRDLQVSGNGYEFDDEKRYLTHLSTEPSGATLSFNGVPIDICSKTPCKVELPEGSVRILAALEHYETADTTISIKQNNQNINIKLKPNFGVLEIKPAYSENIGSGTGWSLAINGKGQSSYENRLSPGNYDVKLSHECYEDISFKTGINKGSREVFDMASNIALKKGGLVLSTEADGEPVSEQVFVNGKLVGETPFSGSVPLCARIEVGKGRETVNVKIRHNMAEKYMHKMNTEERRRRLAEEQERQEQAVKLWEEQQEKERKEREELALFKGPHFAFALGPTFMMKYIHPAYQNNGGFLNFNFEFMSVANGHLHFGVDADIGNFDIDKDKVDLSDEENIKEYWFRGGALTKLYFFDGMLGPYLTAGTGWYKDSYSYSGPSFSVGAGFYFAFLAEVRYFVMPTNGRNAGYIALNLGGSIPYGLFMEKK